MAGAAYAHNRVAMLISNRRGGHISESTLQRAFAHELASGIAECDHVVLSSIFAAARKGEARACRLWILCRMNTPERGGWRERQEVAVGGAVPAKPNSDPRPRQLIVQFVDPDPTLLPEHLRDGRT
jgi:hypothetical protein